MEQIISNVSNEETINFFKTSMNEAVEKNDLNGLRCIIDKIMGDARFDGDGSNRRNKIFADAVIFAQKSGNMEISNLILKEMRDSISGDSSYKDFIFCCKKIVGFEVQKNDVNALKRTLRIAKDKDTDKEKIDEYGLISYVLSKDHLIAAVEKGNKEIMNGFFDEISDKFDSGLLSLLLNISLKNGQQEIVEIILNRFEDNLSMTDLGIAAKNAILFHDNGSYDLIKKVLDKKVNTWTYTADYISASFDNRFDPDKAIKLVTKSLLDKLFAIENKFVSSKSKSPEIDVAKKYLKKIEDFVKNRANYNKKKLMISLIDKNTKVVDEGKTSSTFKEIQSQLEFVLKLESNIRKFENMEEEIALKLDTIKFAIENSGMWRRRKESLLNNIKSVQEQTNPLNFYDKNIIYNALMSKDMNVKIDTDFKIKKPKVHDILIKINKLKECDKRLDREKNIKEHNKNRKDNREKNSVSELKIRNTEASGKFRNFVF